MSDRPKIKTSRPGKSRVAPRRKGEAVGTAGLADGKLGVSERRLSPGAAEQSADAYARFFLVVTGRVRWEHAQRRYQLEPITLCHVPARVSIHQEAMPGEEVRLQVLRYSAGLLPPGLANQLTALGLVPVNLGYPKASQARMATSIFQEMLFEQESRQEGWEVMLRSRLMAIAVWTLRQARRKRDRSSPEFESGDHSADRVARYVLRLQSEISRRETMDEAARALWIRFHDDVERELRPGGKMADVRGEASKAADNAARMAALFHLYAHGAEGQIGAPAVESAGRIVSWHLFQARGFLGEVAVPREVSIARRLDAWILDRCRIKGLAKLPRRDIQNEGPNPVRTRATLDAALAELADAGRIRETNEGRQKLVAVNPKLLGAGNGA